METSINNLPSLFDELSDEELKLLEEIKLQIKTGIPIEFGVGTNKTGLVEKYKSKCLMLQNELSVFKNKLKYLLSLHRKVLQKHEANVYEEFSHVRNKDDKRSLMLNEDSEYFDKSESLDKYEALLSYLDDLIWILRSLTSNI